MTLKEKFLRYIPKKHHYLIKDVCMEDDLIDDCKYMIYFNFPVSICGDRGYYSFPITSFKDGAYWISSIDDICIEYM